MKESVRQHCAASVIGQTIVLHVAMGLISESPLYHYPTYVYLKEKTVYANNPAFNDGRSLNVSFPASYNH